MASPLYAISMVSSIFLVLSTVLIHLTPFATSSAGDNYLLTGETLYTGQNISYNDVSLVMQDDCNLVLNGPRGFESDTQGKGEECTLSFTENGRLVVRNRDGSIVFNTPEFKRGKYAAVIRSDGTLGIYGPAVWSTGRIVPVQRQLRKSLANVPNLLFSGQILDHNDKMTYNGFKFIMRDDGNLVLMEKAGNRVLWESETSGNGNGHPFLRLDHKGKITIVDDNYGMIYSSCTPTSRTGEYVLVLQKNGEVVIYGPKVWSNPFADYKRIVEVTME